MGAARLGGQLLRRRAEGILGGVAEPPGVIANRTLRFSPELPAKLGAAHALPLGVANKAFLRIDRPDDLPKDTRVTGSRVTQETGMYTLRAFGRPVIEGYFGGSF